MREGEVQLEAKLSGSRARRRLAGAVMVCLLLLAAVAGRALGAAGALDPSFSGDGKRTTPFSNTTFDDEASGVAIQGDGRIVVVGETFQNAGEQFALARYRPNGTLDPTFSGDGKRLTAFSGDAEGSGIAIQGNGKIVVVGGGSSGDFAIARYRTNGNLDPAFSNDGKRMISFGDFGEGVHAVAIQSDGKIVVVGSGEATGTAIDFVVIRLRSNGTLDTTFSGDGKRLTSFDNGPASDQGEGVAIQTNGKIVAVGQSAQAGTGDDFAIVRYRANGTLDPTFSGDGKRVTSFDNAGEEDFAHSVAIQRDGRIVAAGYSDQAPGSAFDQDFALARYRTNGTLDPTFSGDGKRLAEFDNGGLSDEANGVAIQGDGKIIAAGGSTQSATGSDFALARFRTDGSLDPAFSGDGKRLVSFDTTGDEADAVAIQRNGRIVAAGTSIQSATGRDFALARILGS